MMDVYHRSHNESLAESMPMAESSLFFPIESPSYYDSSSEVASLEVRFLQSFKCCGLSFSCLRDLMHHKETDAHKEKEPEPKPRISPDPIKFMRRPLSEISQDELRRLGRDLPELELNTTTAPAATLIATAPGTLRSKLNKRQQLRQFQKVILELRRTTQKNPIAVAAVAAHIRGMGTQQPVLPLGCISPALLDSSSHAQYIYGLRAAVQKHRQSQNVGGPPSIVRLINGNLPGAPTIELSRARHIQAYAQRLQKRRQRQAEQLRRIAHVTAARRNQEMAEASGSPQRAALYAQEIQAADRRKQQRHAEWLKTHANVDEGKAFLGTGPATKNNSQEPSRQLEQRIQRLEQRALLLLQRQPQAQRSRIIPHAMRENQPLAGTSMSSEAAHIQARDAVIQPNQLHQQAGRLQTSPVGNSHWPATAMGQKPLGQPYRHDLLRQHRRPFPHQQAANSRVSATVNTVNAAALQIRNRAQFLKRHLGSLPLPRRGAALGPGGGSGAASSSQAGHMQAWETARQQEQRQQAELLRNIDPELLKAEPCTAGQSYKAGPIHLDGVSDAEMADYSVGPNWECCLCGEEENVLGHNGCNSCDHERCAHCHLHSSYVVRFEDANDLCTGE